MRNLYLVDDDDAVRESLEAFLSVSEDLTISSFGSGDEFLANAESLGAGVLVLDLRMPGSSGIDVMHSLLKSDQKFAVIVLTGEGNIALAVEAMKAGAVDFVEKPVIAAHILKVIDLAFSGLELDSAAAARAEEARERIDKLSPRERDILLCLIEGHPNKVIANKLGLSPRTTEIYRANMMAKLSVRSLPAAMKIAFSAGLVSLSPK